MGFNSTINGAHDKYSDTDAAAIKRNEDIRKGFILPSRSESSVAYLNADEIAARDAGRVANTGDFSSHEMTGGMRFVNREAAEKYARIQANRMRRGGGGFYDDDSTDDDSEDDAMVGAGIQQILRAARRKARRLRDKYSSDSDSDSDSEMEGGKIRIGRIIKKAKRGTNKAIKKVKKTANQVDQVSKPLQKQIIKEAIHAGDVLENSATSKKGVIRQLASGALDTIPVATGIAGEYGGMALGAAAGTALGGPAGTAVGAAVGKKMGQALGKEAGKVGRTQIEQQTGYGFKGVGKYKPADLVKKYTTSKSGGGEASLAVMPKVPRPKRKVSEAVLARREAVSRIMKEKGLSLPMASKYVKEHGIA